ncbi:cell division suppressor protein YneA [Miniphocaeibacter massiliensis]|uniref:cell division suppressor protein YneA n=1 Tax=Miniphocaeibacter massiliensis TaxID=2041841 RepID=UPI0013EA205F|nr:LysM peptidoglycan-binding domain-containing protein [Miniphocaeibacter massiliensis]
MKRKKYRIINRKRFLTFVFMCVVLLTLTIVLFVNIKSSFGSTKENNIDYYIIRHGDTVWSVAEEFNTNKKVNIRDFVDIIIEENSINNSNLIPGEKIKIPIL